MRQIGVVVKGPGAGREPAARGLQAAGFKVTYIRDVTPIPHNGCRAAEAAPRVRRILGSLHRCSLPVLPPGGHEALPEGRALLHGQVLDRAPQLPARPARPGARRSSRTTACSCARSRRCSRIYGVLERQFRKTVAEASRMKGVTGENLMALLERRLDNVVFRLGFVDLAHRGAPARAPRPLLGQRRARRHSVVPRAEGRQDRAHARAARRRPASRGRSRALETRGMPELARRSTRTRSRVRSSRDPVRDEITLPIKEQLIIELYSR